MPTTTPTSYLYRQWLNPPSPPSTPKSRHPSLPFLPTLSPPPQRWIARCTSRCASAWSPLRWWSMSTRGRIQILVVFGHTCYVMRCDAMLAAILRTWILMRGMLCYDSHEVYLLSRSLSILSIWLITPPPLPPPSPLSTKRTHTNKQHERHHRLCNYAMMIGSYKSMIKHLNLNLNPRSVSPRPSHYPSHHPLSTLATQRIPREGIWPNPGKHHCPSESNIRDSSTRDGSNIGSWLLHAEYPRWMDTPHAPPHMIFLLQPGLAWLIRCLVFCSLDLRISTLTFFFFILDICWSIGRMLYFLWISDFLFLSPFCCLFGWIAVILWLFPFSLFLIIFIPLHLAITIR